MRFYPLYLIAIAAFFFLPSCKKNEERMKESYTISGNVSYCPTGMPLGGVSLKIIAQRDGEFGEEDIVGEAVTDANGHYEIQPYVSNKITGNSMEHYLIQVVDGNYIGSLDITADTFYKNNPVGSFDLSLVRAAYIQVYVENAAPIDTADKLIIGGHSIAAGCKQDLFSLFSTDISPNKYGHSQGKTPDEIGVTLKGYVAGTMKFMVRGDDTLELNYRSIKTGIGSYWLKRKLYCAAGTTTPVLMPY